MVGRLAAAGQKVALVERDLIGGTCVNTGCTPTKTLVASAYAAHLARRGADFGVKVGPVEIDFAAVMARKNASGRQFPLASQRTGWKAWRIAPSSEVMPASSPRLRVAIGDDVLEAERFFINVGGRAAHPRLSRSRSGEDADQHDAA